MATSQEPQRFVERQKREEAHRPIVTPETELEILRARQKLALTMGGIALVLLLIGGAIAFVLLQRWSRHQTAMSLAQVPSSPAPITTGSLVQTPVQPPNPSMPNLAQTPVQPPNPPMPNLTQTPVQPPNPPMPNVVQTPAQPTPPTAVVSPPRLSPQRPPTPPKALSDYLEQLRRIEQQRKREAKNFWIALQALSDLVKALQGVAASGDILDAPSDYDPQKTLRSYDAYQARFNALRQWLHQLQPPPECLTLHNAYDQALQAHINAIGKLKERVRLKDLAGVAFSSLGAQGQIDGALQTADSELEAVCAQYGIAKFFTIGDK